MRVSPNLPPYTAETEPLHLYINYLRMMLRLTLSGIVAGDFDGDKRQACVDALRNELE
jgi:hypothetical protein